MARAGSASTPAPSALGAALRPELPAEAMELAQALGEPVWRRLELVPERLTVLWVPPSEPRAGPVASPASVAILVELQEPLSRLESIRGAVPERRAPTALAGAGRLALLHALALPALAQPAQA